VRDSGDDDVFVVDGAFLCFWFVLTIPAAGARMRACTRLWPELPSGRRSRLEYRRTRAVVAVWFGNEHVWPVLWRIRQAGRSIS